MQPNFCPFLPPFNYAPIAQLTHSSFPFSYPYFYPFSSFSHQYYQPPLQEKLQVYPTIQSPTTTIEREQAKTVLKKKAKESKMESLPSQSKKTPKQLIEQKQGRNAQSNLLRMFFRRLALKIDSQERRILKIIQRYRLTVSLQQFSEWVHKLNIDYRNYIRVSTIKKAFRSGVESKDFTCLMRVLFKMFVEEESLCCYLTSKKIKKNILSYSLKCLRSIPCELYEEGK